MKKNSQRRVTKSYAIIDGKEISFEIEKVAPRANGVLARVDGTTILCTCVIGQKVTDHYIPLSVHYIEKFSALNKIPGGYKKREGSPTDSEILTARLIDKALRATIDAAYEHDIQVIIQVLSYDGYACDVLAIAAASVALNLAGVTRKLVSAARIAADVINRARVNNSMPDFIQAICDDKIVMLEFTGTQMQGGIFKSAIKYSLDAIKTMQAKSSEIANEFLVLQKILVENLPELPSVLEQKADKELCAQALIAAAESMQCLGNAKDIRHKFIKQFENRPLACAEFDKCMRDLFTSTLLKQGRLDGRDWEEVRDLNMEVKFIPGLHGSAFFQRGETQALVSVTIAQAGDGQNVETLQGTYRENFMLHYNFLPYSVAEVGKIGPVSRREIGHGELARKAFLSVMPKRHDYTLRVVSDITSSNGSSSMATVCGASLALFDAGVPIEEHVAGVSVGLIAGKNTKLLVDITAVEDEFGAMDFKIAGTKHAITAMQLDIKNLSGSNCGISPAIFEKSLKLAHKKIKDILAQMNEIISKPNNMAINVEKRVLRINPAKIRLVIGKDGSMINAISSDYGVKIDVDKSGKVYITASNASGVVCDMEKAIEKINSLVQ